MSKEEIIETFKSWGNGSMFYKNFAIPFFTDTQEGQDMLAMLAKKKFHSPNDLRLFMMSIGVK